MVSAEDIIDIDTRRIVMGASHDWEGIYEINVNSYYGLMEIHEWSDWFDEDELEDMTLPPEGAWYIEWRVNGITDGAVLGYRHGDTFQDLENCLRIVMIRRICGPEDGSYEGMLMFIRQEDRSS